MPLPTLSGTASNFFNSGTLKFNRDNFDVKVNWNRTDKHALFVKYSAMNGNASCGFPLGSGRRGGVGAAARREWAHTLAQISTIGHTLTIFSAVRSRWHHRLDAHDPAGQDPGLRYELRARRAGHPGD